MQGECTDVGLNSHLLFLFHLFTMPLMSLSSNYS